MDQEKDRYYLPCANDDNTPTCFICRSSFSTMKSLFLHMSRHSDSRWRQILPSELRNAAVIVRRTLFPISITSDLLSESESESDGLKFDDDDDDAGGGDRAVDLTKFLPAVKRTGKRGRPGRRFGSPGKNGG